MNYIYDILLNFNDNFYDFYDWNVNDDICHIRKIPLLRVTDKTYLDIKNNDILIEDDILRNIENKTEMFLNKSVSIIPHAFLISNGKEALALLVSNKIKKSSLLIDEELEVLEEIEKINIVDIKYKIKNIRDNNFNTRKQLEMKKYIIKELKKLNKEENSDKLKYIYYECFNKKIDNKNKILEKFYYNIDNNSIEIYEKLYKFFKLIQFNK